MTTFVGRRSEVSQAKRLLSAGRLVTFIGPGGVGKTRLALRVGAETHRAFPDGVWLVELAALDQDELVTHVVADALGLTDHLTETTAQLAEYLQDKSLLLILDNCEHLVDACGILAAKLLASVPGVRILATSRHVLGIEGEHLLPIRPLPTPPADSRADDGLLCEAMRMFADRAEAAAPGFQLTSHNQETVSAICRRLEGVPLAIELAAVRCRALTPEELLARLDDALDVLTTGHRNAAPRQRSLEDAIGWSYDLCSPAEQRLWARTSVFRGGFGIEAIEQVCSGDGIEPHAVFDLVAALVDKSVLVRVEGSYGRQARFQLLSTLRQFGQARLAAEEDTAVRVRHCEYYQSLVDQGDSEMFHAGEMSWLTRLRADHGNLRAVLDFCLTTPGRQRAGMDIAARLQSFWFACGLIREGYLWLRRALDIDDERTAVRANALTACSYFGMFVGEQDEAVEMLEEASAIAHASDDQRTLADIDSARAVHALFNRDTTSAKGLLDKALQRYVAPTDDASIHRALYLKALSGLSAEDSDAQAYAEEALAMVTATGAGWSKGNTLWVLGLYRLRGGEAPAAAQLFGEALAAVCDTNDQRAMAQYLRSLACSSAARSDHERAATLFGVAERLWELSGASHSTTYVKELFADYQQRVRDALGADRWEVRYSEGKPMTTSEAVDYALRRSTKSTSAPKRAATQVPALTRREREIALLVGEGMTNKEIAAQLVIARRTAEAHVEHILTKLGFRSRAQIASWITDRSRG